MCRLEQRIGGERGHDGRGSAEGKIEARGTRGGLRPCLHIGFGGTPPSRRGAPGWAKRLEGDRIRRASSAGLRWSGRRGPF